MAITIDLIKLKRGTDSDVQAASLQRGEPAVSLDTKSLWVGDGTGNIKITDVYFYNTFTNLPATGKVNKVYIIKDTGSFYIWDDVGLEYKAYEFDVTSGVTHSRCRMSTNTLIPGSWQSIVYSNHDGDTNSAKLEYDGVNQDRIIAHEEGWYRCAYGVVYDIPIVGGGASSAIDCDILSRLAVNGSSPILATYNENAYKFESGHQGITDTLTNEAIVYMNAGDYISVQVQSTGDPAYVQWSDLEVYNVLSAKGDKGLPGTPGSIWHNGSGVPALFLGNDTDYYLDNTNGDVYYKSGGIWSLTGGNLTGPQGEAGVVTPLPAVQSRRTTEYTLPVSSWGSLTFDATDVETDNTIIEHDNTNTERILIKEAGMYLMGFYGDIDDEGMVRVIKNGTTLIPGSQRDYGAHDDSVNLEGPLGGMFMATLAANDYLEVQLQAASTAEILRVNPIFIVIKMQAPKGDDGDQGIQGPPGEAFSIDEYDDLDEAKITSIESGSGASPSNLYYFLTLDDARSNQTLPATLNGDMTGHVVMYDGVSWYDFGPFTGLQGPKGDTGSTGSGVVDQNYATSETTSQTTNNTFEQKLRLSATGLEGGTYRIGWYYEWNHNNRGSDFKAQIQIDDTTTVMEQQQEPNDAKTSQFGNVGGFAYAPLTAGDHDVDLDWCASALGDTATIRRARLELWKVG